MSWLFLIAGLAAAVLTRNALAAVLLSAVALPVGFVLAWLTGGPVLSAGFWMFLCFVLGAAAGFAGLVILSLLGLQWAKDLKLSLWRGAPGGKQGL